MWRWPYLGVVDGWLAFLVGFFLLLGVISAGGTGCCGTAGATGCCKDWIKLTTSGACIRLSRVGAGTTGAVGVAAFFGVAFFRPLGVAGAASVCWVAAAAGKGCVGSWGTAATTVAAGVTAGGSLFLAAAFFRPLGGVAVAAGSVAVTCGTAGRGCVGSWDGTHWVCSLYRVSVYFTSPTKTSFFQNLKNCGKSQQNKGFKYNMIK